MKRFLITLFAGLVLPVMLLGSDFIVPELTGRVVDQSKTLNAKEKRRIESAILQLESATGGQMVVVFLNSIGNTPIEEVGIMLGNTWQIGHKERDNGAILIVVPDDRQMRLEIGYGWEGPVNDARAGDIIRGLQDFFRAEDYAGGAVYAVNKVQEFVTGEAPEGMEEPPESAKEPWYEDSTILTFIGIIIFIILSFIPNRDGFHGSGGRFGGGFRGGGGFFRGGGGRFGGGGASGRW